MLSFLLRKSTVGGLLFLLLYPLDSLAYVLSGYLGQGIPVGFIGVVLAFVSMGFILHERGSGLNLIFGYVFLFLPLVVLSLLSHRSQLQDYYFWARSLAFFYAGVCFFAWLYKQKEKPSFVFNMIYFASVFVFLFIDYSGINYLRVSDGFAVFSFFLLSAMRSRPGSLFPIVSVLSVMVLYGINSRFSLMAFILSVFLLIFLSAGSVKRVLYIAFSSLAISVLYFVGLYVFLHLESVHDNRLLRLIFSADSDTSFSGRSEMLTQAVNVFLANPVLGDYKYYRSAGSEGAYAHNFMSFWAEFGVFGMFFSSFIIIVSCLAGWLSYKRLKSKLTYISFVFFSAVYLLLGLALAKSYVWSSLYFLFGVLLSFCVLEIRLNKKYANPLPPPTSS